MRTTPWRALTTALLAVSTGLGVALPASAGGASDQFPETIDLPPGFFPEGIAVGRGSTFYVGSLADGSVYRGDLRTGDGAVLTEPFGPFTTVGLAVDQRNRVWVAGGPSGTARVHDGGTGELLATYALTAPFQSFVNDVIVTPDAAYFTDSGTQIDPDPSAFQFAGEPRLFEVPLGAAGALPDPSAIRTIPVSTPGASLDVAFPNLNGIETLPGTDDLVVAHTTLGALLRVDRVTGVAEEVYTGDLAGADGLVRRGRSIHVVENGAGEISEIRYSPATGTGTLSAVRPVPEAAETPTTAALFGSTLYAVDARFGSMTGPYQVFAVPL